MLVKVLKNERSVAQKKGLSFGVKVHLRALAWKRAVGEKLRSTSGQGTTEYAILVGVLVVIAIIAITVFRPKLEELWTAIADGISSL